MRDDAKKKRRKCTLLGHANTRTECTELLKSTRKEEL